MPHPWLAARVANVVAVSEAWRAGQRGRMSAAQRGAAQMIDAASTRLQSRRCRQERCCCSCLLERAPSPSPPWLQAVVKACAGNFTIFPIYLGSFFLYMGLLEGLRPAQALQKLRQAFVPT